MSYYQRPITTHIDGSPIFKNAEDERIEALVATEVEAAWKLKLGSFGRLSALDWWAERDGRVVGVLELKGRDYPSTRYPYTWLNVRKWMALIRAADGLGVPAVLIVHYTDGTYWVRVVEIDAEGTRVLGTTHIVKSRNDREPIIRIPVAALRPLRARKEG